MLRLAADENFDATIVRGLLRRLPTLDLVTVQDAGLRRALDPVVLTWTAETDRILLTHDVSTLVPLAHEWTRIGRSMTGVFAVHRQSRIGAIVDDVALLAAASDPDEWRDRVLWLPL